MLCAARHAYIQSLERNKRGKTHLGDLFTKQSHLTSFERLSINTAWITVLLLHNNEV